MGSKASVPNSPPSSPTPIAGSARHHLLNTDGFSHPRENAATLLTTSFAIAAGVCALIPAMHVLGCWAGIAGLATGLYAQMISATTAERLVNVTAMTVSGIGLLMGLAHGGLY
jgi:hypothetical protein